MFFVTVFSIKTATSKNWKAKKLFELLDERAAGKEYCQGRACQNANVLVIGWFIVRMFVK